MTFIKAEGDGGEEQSLSEPCLPIFELAKDPLGQD